jgi:hypothetical protein
MSDDAGNGDDPERTAYWLARLREKKVDKGEAGPFTTQENAAFIVESAYHGPYDERYTLYVSAVIYLVRVVSRNVHKADAFTSICARLRDYERNPAGAMLQVLELISNIEKKRNNVVPFGNGL